MSVTGNDLADFVDYDKAFDPTDIAQWQGAATERSKLQILDDIYQATEKKILNGIKQTRITNMKGKQRQKSLMMEKMELIEDRVTKQFDMDVVAKGPEVIDINKKELAGQKDKINYEKMKGRFKVKINRKLQMMKQVQSLANDPVIYYLHKNRHFIRKLRPTKKEEQTASEQVQELAGKLDQMFLDQRRDLHYAKQGIDPRNDYAIALADDPFESRFDWQEAQQSTIPSQLDVSIDESG